MAKPKDPTPKKKISVNVPQALYDELNDLLPRSVTDTELVNRLLEAEVKRLRLAKARAAK